MTTTVVLLHGIPGSSRDWTSVRERLSEVRTIAPDLLGFGTRANGASDLWVDAQAKAVYGDLPRDGDLILVGHDFGGPVAIQLLASLTGRVRGLVLAATNTFPDTPVPFPLTLVRLPMVPRLLLSGPALRMMLRDHDDPDSALGSRAQQAAIRRIFTTALRELPQRYTDIERRLRASDVPARVIWGDRDPFFSVSQGRRTAEAAGASLDVVAGAGHFLPRQAPQAFVDAIKEL